MTFNKNVYNITSYAIITIYSQLFVPLFTHLGAYHFHEPLGGLEAVGGAELEDREVLPQLGGAGANGGSLGEKGGIGTEGKSICL